MFKQNDILVDKQGHECKVLGVCGEIVFYKNSRGETWATGERLVIEGWTLKQEKWKPKNGEVYYRIAEDGWIEEYSWRNNQIDQFLLSIGNVHHTEFDALAYKEKLLKWASENN